MKLQLASLLAALCLISCKGTDEAPSHGHGGRHPHGHHAAAQPAGEEELLRKVAEIHGAAGPFAVAGYRMGAAALRKLELEPGRFDLLVVHESPAKVQWSCVADGLQAATGTSVGKLNLRWLETSDDRVESRIGTRDGSKQLIGKLAPAFLERFKDVPRERLLEAGREVATLPEEQIFTLEPPPAEAR